MIVSKENMKIVMTNNVSVFVMMMKMMVGKGVVRWQMM